MVALPADGADVDELKMLQIQVRLMGEGSWTAIKQAGNAGGCFTERTWKDLRDKWRDLHEAEVAIAEEMIELVLGEDLGEMCSTLSVSDDFALWFDFALVEVN